MISIDSTYFTIPRNNQPTEYFYITAQNMTDRPKIINSVPFVSECRPLEVSYGGRAELKLVILAGSLNINIDVSVDRDYYDFPVSRAFKLFDFEQFPPTEAERGYLEKFTGWMKMTFSSFRECPIFEWEKSEKVFRLAGKNPSGAGLAIC